MNNAIVGKDIFWEIPHPFHKYVLPPVRYPLSCRKRWKMLTRISFAGRLLSQCRCWQSSTLMDACYVVLFMSNLSSIQWCIITSYSLQATAASPMQSLFSFNHKQIFSPVILPLHATHKFHQKQHSTQSCSATRVSWTGPSLQLSCFFDGFPF